MWNWLVASEAPRKTTSQRSSAELEPAGGLSAPSSAAARTAITGIQLLPCSSSRPLCVILGVDVVLAERADQHGADHGRVLAEEAIAEPVNGSGAEVGSENAKDRGRREEPPCATVVQRADARAANTKSSAIATQIRVASKSRIHQTRCTDLLRRNIFGTSVRRGRFIVGRMDATKVDAERAKTVLAEIVREARGAGLLRPATGTLVIRALFGTASLVALLAFAWTAESTPRALVAAALAGFACVQLGFIAHDAGHGSVGRSRLGNGIAGHLAFTLLNGLGFQSWRVSHGRTSRLLSGRVRGTRT